MTEAAEKYETTEKQTIDTAMTTRGGLVPSNLEQMWRLAVIMSKSGLMPKGLQTPEAVCVAVQMGLEVGLTPMQAVQNIAVINGRPAVWGDSGIALVEASGLLEDFKETITVEGDVITATCWAKRKNRPTPVERTFTTIDAKQAGLHGKEGPWKQYPKRMTQMRARWWVLRDLFADVLKGLKAAEEVQDVIDVTPESARTLKPADDKPTGAKIYDIKGEKPADPQPAPEVAATTQPEAPPVFKCSFPDCKFTSESERGLKKHITQSHTVKMPDPKQEPPPPLVDFETGEVAEDQPPMDEAGQFVQSAEKILAELTDSNKSLVLRLYGILPGTMDEIKGQLRKMLPGYRQAFMSKASKALDSQNAKG
jgi:hypothetical protein